MAAGAALAHPVLRRGGDIGNGNRGQCTTICCENVQGLPPLVVGAAPVVDLNVPGPVKDSRALLNTQTGPLGQKDDHERTP